MRLFLIRHGESYLNTEKNKRFDLPNPIIDLTENGVQQAEKAGEFLKKFFTINNYDINKTYVIYSPYVRTKRTFEVVNTKLNAKCFEENIGLIEQYLGIFTDYPKDIWEDVFPKEYGEYLRYKNNSCKFWFKYPSGESGFDVANRLYPVTYKIKDELKQKGFENVVIISHALTLRVFSYLWMSKTINWVNEERCSGNCWIRMIDNQLDMKYIYKG